MNLATLQFMSGALGRHVTYTAILPDPALGEGPFPVVYQLHGASDDHTAWIRFSRLVLQLQGYPMIVVFPDGGLSYWLNYSPRERYEDFLIQDLMSHVQSAFRARAGKAAIGGLSMGGFGAIRLGMKYPERFCSVWGHSSALRMPSEPAGRFGGVPPRDPEDADVFAWADRLADRRPKPESQPYIGLDCGTGDSLIEHNRRFPAHLEKLGLPHTYREHPGGHTWEYWSRHMMDGIRRHARAFGIRRQPLPQ